MSESKSRVYRDPYVTATTKLLGLRGHTYLYDSKAPRVRIRHVHEAFLVRRAEWFCQYWHLDWASSHGMARREQELALFYTTTGPVSFGYGYDLNEWYELLTHLGIEEAGMAARQLIWEHILEEEEKRRTPPYFEAGYVFAPYVPGIVPPMKYGGEE